MGDNYGLNDNYEYFETSLDSIVATTSANGTSASSDWPNFLVEGKGPIQDVVAIKILEAQIPFSWYVFNDVNNTFIMTDDSGTNTVTIPVGNYTSGTLVTALETAIISATGDATYVVDYNPTLGKLEFANTSATNVFSFTFGAGYGIPGVQPNSGNKNPRLWIGFPPGTSTSVVVGGVQKLVSPNFVLISGAPYVYINSTKLGSDVNMYLPYGAFNQGGGTSGPQVAKVPVNTTSGGTIIWSDPDPQKWFKYSQLQSLSYFDFYLTLGNTTSQVPLQLNGLGFSLKLGILIQLKNHEDRVTPTAQNGRVSMRTGPKRQRPTY